MHVHRSQYDIYELGFYTKVQTETLINLSVIYKKSAPTTLEFYLSRQQIAKWYLCHASNTIGA